VAVGVVVVAVVAGLSAAVAAATVTDTPVLLIVCGLVVEFVVALGGLLMLRSSTRRMRVAAVVAAVILTAVSGFAAAVPRPDARPAPAVAGQAFWQLDTGSRIRHVHMAARGPRRPHPVVFLHGGPGVPDMAGDAAYLRPLRDDGFDVYVYDQLGSGRSTRLPDPSGYGVDRDVADLEAVRERIGADRMILVGHSYGTDLAARYLARHPEHVARLVLLSPGRLDPADTSGANATARLDAPGKLRLYGSLAAPRSLLGYLLLQVNPRAAHAYMPDAEADARNDQVLRMSAPALHCTPAQAHRPAPGSGFYALQYPQSAASGTRTDPRPALRGAATPTLILKGSCDYLSWPDHQRTLSDVTLLYYRGAGHNITQDRPDDVLAAIRAFLTDAPLPQPPYRGTDAPDDFEGPRWSAHAYVRPARATCPSPRSVTRGTGWCPASRPADVDA
jgi:proline iminopeptidase